MCRKEENNNNNAAGIVSKKSRLANFPSASFGHEKGEGWDEVGECWVEGA